MKLCKYTDHLKTFIARNNHVVFASGTIVPLLTLVARLSRMMLYHDLQGQKVQEYLDMGPSAARFQHERSLKEAGKS